MTKYKFQTNPALLTQAELTDSGGQLLTHNGASNVVVGNPANSTPLATLGQTYATDALDISIAKTLGQGFIFLNGTSFDAMGVGAFEFEESNGTVYGLYGRTDGLSQQVYFSGAWNNKQALQYTTVPYVPPFLSGNIWQAACVVGSDLQGFTLALRNTTPGSTASLRYIYVRHNGSLLNTSGHTYVEITSAVNSILSNASYTAGAVPRVIRVGAYYFMLLSDWQQGSLWVGGWNAQDGSFPFTTAALPASPISYTPTQFTITTNGLPGGDITSAAAFPSIFGNNSPGGSGIWRLYNMQSGAVSTPTYYNCPEPLAAGWSTNMGCLLEGEVDGGGNPYLALGTIVAPGDANNNGVYALAVYSVSVTFTAGSAGAYTNAQLNIVQAGASGSDLYHCQPGPPFYIGYNPTSYTPQESVQSNTGVPSTCVNKLPIAAWYTGEGNLWGGSPTIHWYYSGAQSLSAFGGGAINRGVTRPVGAQAGSLAAARANKLASLYPMFNVANRMDFNPSTGTQMAASFVQPSGQLLNSYFGHMIGQDLILSTGVSARFQQIWTVSKLPSGSNITDASYNRNGTTVPGFGGRVAEYLANLPGPWTSLSNWGCVWPTAIPVLNNPVNFNFPAITDSGPFAGSVNNAGCRLGSWSLSGGQYQPPPVVWNYASNMSAQLAALKSTVLAAAQAAYSGFAGGGVLGIDVCPVMNSAGNGIVFAVGVLHARNSANNQLQVAAFITPCGVSGSTINLTNTGSVTLVGNVNGGTSGVPGVYTANDVFYGRLFVTYATTAGGNWYLGWTNPNCPSVAGDAIGTNVVIEFNSSNAVVASGMAIHSQSRCTYVCSAQHQGLACFPYRDGDTVPEADMPISRFATSAVNTQNDFAAGFANALNNANNIIPGDPQSRSYNIAEMMVLSSINNQFLLQLGSISGRLNHKEFVLPSTFIDMTAAAPGVYYLYVVDTGAGGIQIQYDSAQRAESATNMYFGTFTRTTTGFSNENSIQEVIRYGTARLQVGNITAPIPGSCIRTGPYPMATT